ncbi:MAG: molecular chaperone HscC, partial [Myxococcales bacterium FL481]
MTSEASGRGGIAIGIDLGTSNSLAAWMVGGEPVIIPNRFGSALTPSVVSIDGDGTVLVGASARARRVAHPRETAQNFKRDMGTDQRVPVGRQKYSPEELSALVLSQIRQDVEASTGREILDAVVTVPAYFGEAQRRATARACELAGIPMERMINEPTAAALAYGVGARDAACRVAVLDLGGGTFDVSILDINDGLIEISSTAGDARLGGEDFLDRLVELVASRMNLTRRSESDSTWSSLVHGCERAKHELTDAESTRVALAAHGRELTVQRTEFEQACAQLIHRIEICIRRALDDAKRSPNEIDEVLLVGGATRMPLVARLATTMFGRLPNRSLPPDEAVALGAAVQAAIKHDEDAVEDLVVTDIAPFSLGVDTSERLAHHHIEGVFSPIIDRGTVLPTSRSRLYSTMVDGQVHIEFGVYQGEHSLCSRNTKLGVVRVDGVPPGPAGTQHVEARFTYDLNGLLEVDVTVLDTGVTQTALLGQAQRTMSKTELARARESLQRLKFHPRDALPNTRALARAEVG